MRSSPPRCLFHDAECSRGARVLGTRPTVSEQVCRLAFCVCVWVLRGLPVAAVAAGAVAICGAKGRSVDKRCGQARGAQGRAAVNKSPTMFSCVFYPAQNAHNLAQIKDRLWFVLFHDFFPRDLRQEIVQNLKHDDPSADTSPPRRDAFCTHPGHIWSGLFLPYDRSFRWNTIPAQHHDLEGHRDF